MEGCLVGTQDIVDTAVPFYWLLLRQAAICKLFCVKRKMYARMSFIPGLSFTDRVRKLG